MRILSYFAIVLIAATAPLLHAAESKRTAEFILTTPAVFEGQEVTVDVSFVSPVKWKSPVADLAFFHAMTVDRRDHKFGGEILVAIPAADASKFAKKYGTDRDGRYESDSLKATFVAAPGGRRRANVYVLDTTGKIAELVKKEKFVLVDEEGAATRGPGPLRRRLGAQ